VVQSSDPVVDLVVAVHSTARPVERAVASVLAHTRTPLRVTVVCHDVDPGLIAEKLGASADDPRVRLIEHRDGVRSPSGPFNRGMDEATAPFVSIMGSDDLLEPGTVDSWVERQRAGDADVVVTHLRHAAGAYVPTPPVRPWRTRRLDGSRDRLAYRSAPLGIVRRSAFPGLRLTEGAPVGGDIAFVLALWFSGRRISYDRTGPAYVIGADAADRVTFRPKPVAEEFTYLSSLLEDESFLGLGPREKASYAVKFLRVQVFGAVHNRPDPDFWTADERAALRAVTLQVLALAPGAERVLSIADRRVLDAVLDPGTPVEVLFERSVARRRFRSPAALVTRDLTRVLAREAPLRFMVASVLSRR
jgi:glycosyltransferase involved in cell wall biosynthesis